MLWPVVPGLCPGIKKVGLIQIKKTKSLLWKILPPLLRKLDKIPSIGS